MHRRAFLALSLPLGAAVVAPNLAAAQTTTNSRAQTMANVNLRTGPSTGNAVLLVVPAGEFVTVTGAAQRGFYPVTYRTTNGWVSGTYLDFTTSAAPVTTATVDASNGLRLRSGPSASSTVLLTMPDGARVQLTGGRSGAYVSVLYRGRNGWAAARYLDIPTSPPPDPEPPVIDTATVISSRGLNLRAGPSNSTTLLLVVPSGATVDVTGAAVNGYFPVIYRGTAGWGWGESLDASGEAPLPNPEQPPATGTATVTTSRLNLRAAPSTSAAVLAVMSQGATVTVTGSARDGFLPVTYRGVQGWAAAQYLRVAAGPPPPSSPVTLAVTDKLVRAPRGGIADALSFAVRSGAARQSEVEAYLREVYAYAPVVGLDPAIVVSQSALETGNWTSKWWRERLNPAGIGITGTPAEDAASKTWASGTESARAQIVHLALYAGVDDTPAVQQYRYLDPRYDIALAVGYRGAAETIDDLSGSWAVDPLYAQKIVNRGNGIF